MNQKIYRLLLIIILFFALVYLLYSGYTEYEPVEHKGLILQKKMWRISRAKWLGLGILIIGFGLLYLNSLRKERIEKQLE